MINKLKNIANTEDKKRILGNFFSLSVLQAFTYILPLLTLPYLVRVLGVDKFGLVMFAQAFIMFFNILVDYGFNLSATREISIHRDDKSKVTEIFSSVMTIKAILIFVSFVLLTIVIFSFEKFSSDWELYYLSFLLVIGNAMFPIWYFQGMEKMKYITIVNISSKVIFTILIFIVIQEPNDYIYVPLLSGFGFIVGGIISLWIVYKNFNQSFLFQRFNILKKHFQDSSQFFLSRLSSVGYSNSNTFLVGVMLSPQFVTYYYLADKAISVVLSVFDPIIQSIYPYLSKKFNFTFLIKLLSMMMFSSLIIVIVLFTVSDYLSLFLLKEVNGIFVNTLTILLAVIPVSIFYVMLGAPLLLARGYKKEFNKSIIYGFIIHLLILTILYIYYLLNTNINEILIYLFAGSLLFSKFIVMFIRMYYVYKYKVYKR